MKFRQMVFGRTYRIKADGVLLELMYHGTIGDRQIPLFVGWRAIAGPVMHLEVIEESHEPPDHLSHWA